MARVHRNAGYKQDLNPEDKNLNLENKNLNLEDKICCISFSIKSLNFMFDSSMRKKFEI